MLTLLGYGGSSPRARGTRGKHRRENQRNRFIPACAGNTRHWTRRTLGRPVHPRVRGEHYTKRCGPGKAYGSSPRARGTRGTREIRRTGERFIPACAGNTRVSAFAAGSSPRARGTLHPVVGLFAVGRFIPACAGNTTPNRRCPDRSAVHPRVRGEHFPETSHMIRPSGSSPRARGTLSAEQPRRPAWRFIPACAGNTAAKKSAYATDTVHPRVRGEHSPPWSAALRGGGSSPRARGTLLVALGRREPRRFIPACAGNTARSWLSSYPRVRGEHSFRKPLIAILFCHVKERTRLRRGNSWANWMVDERIVALTGVNSIADPHPTAGISQA